MKRKNFQFALCLLFIISLNSCIVFREMRALVKHAPNIRDGQLFAHDTIYNNPNSVFRFAEQPTNERILDTMKFTFNNYGKPIKNKTFAEFTCRDGGASAFIIIQNDTIKYEHYNGWLKKLDNVNIFSVSKSITALLCGIAIKEGKIHSIDDYVTDYIPELRTADKHFKSLKIRHLLNMQAGLKFKEKYSNPFCSMALLYFGHDMISQIKKLKFKTAPGSQYEYNSMTTAILSYVLERATGTKYAQYLSEKTLEAIRYGNFSNCNP